MGRTASGVRPLPPEASRAARVLRSRDPTMYRSGARFARSPLSLCSRRVSRCEPQRLGPQRLPFSTSTGAPSPRGPTRRLRPTIPPRWAASSSGVVGANQKRGFGIWSRAPCGENSPGLNSEVERESTYLVFPVDDSGLGIIGSKPKI